MGILKDILDVLLELRALEYQFWHDMQRNPIFHTDLSDNVEHLHDIITAFERILNISKSGETK